MNDATTKTCSVCKQVFPLSCFGKNSKNRDSLQAYCQGCAHEKFKRYYAKHKEITEYRLYSNLELPSKVCSHCKDLLPPKAFSNDKSRLDGLSRWCKECWRKCKANRPKANRPKANRPLTRTCSIATLPVPDYGPKEVELESVGLERSGTYPFLPPQHVPIDELRAVEHSQSGDRQFLEMLLEITRLDNHCIRLIKCEIPKRPTVYYDLWRLLLRHQSPVKL